MERYTITILDERAEELEAMLGTTTLPILKPVIEQVGTTRCVRVNLNALDDDQQIRLLRYMAYRRGVALEKIKESLAIHGLPVPLGNSEINIEKDDAPAID
jgi:hypothetical protein